MNKRKVTAASRLERGSFGHLPPEALFDGILLNGVFEKDVADAYVPLHLIDDEEVPVDEDHVLELADQIGQRAELTGDRGQLEHIFLGHIPGLKKFVIIDGFHRVPALALASQPDALSRIKLNSSWEEVTDLRIQTARPHRTVKFSRVVTWIEDIWGRTEWADKISAVQAFGLEQSAAVTPGQKLNLSIDEVNEIRRWVKGKCELWKSSPSTILDNLSTASAADPYLVRTVRGGDQAGPGSVNPAQLKAIVQALPFRFDLQQLAANSVSGRRLSAEDAGSLAWAIAPAEDINEAQAIIEEKLRGPTRSPIRKVSRRKFRSVFPGISGIERPKSASKELLEKYFIDEIELAYAALEVAVLRARYIPPPIGIQDNTRFLPPLKSTEHVKLPDHNTDAVWPEDKIEAIANYLEMQNSNLEDQVSNIFKLDRSISSSVLDAAKARLIFDLHDGALKHVPIDDKNHINRLLAKIIEDEIKVRNLAHLTPLASGSEPGAATLFYEFSDIPPLLVSKPDYLDTIRRILPDFNTQEKRCLILSTYFNLSIQAICRVLGKDTNDVESALVKVGRTILQEVK